MTGRDLDDLDKCSWSPLEEVGLDALIRAGARYQEANAVVDRESTSLRAWVDQWARNALSIYRQTKANKES